MIITVFTIAENILNLNNTCNNTSECPYTGVFTYSLVYKTESFPRLLRILIKINSYLMCTKKVQNANKCIKKNYVCFPFSFNNLSQPTL